MADTIYTTDIINEVARDSDVPADIVRKVIDHTFNEIAARVIAGVDVTITGFGRFERRYMAPRKLADHLSGDSSNHHDVPGHYRVGFHVASVFRRLMRGTPA